MSRPRLLMIAYCCSPVGGSEPAVGWTLANLASERFDVTVLVEEHKFAAAIRAYLDEHGPIPGVTFEFVPEKWWAHPMWAAGVGYISYRWWHDRALERAKQLHAEQPFDAVQLATIIGFREPGRWTELGVPFLWGPVGGTHNYTPAFLGEAGWVGGWQERIRSSVNHWQLHSSRRVKRTLAEAHSVVAATSQTRADLQAVTDRPIDVVSEITLPDRERDVIVRDDVSDGLRVLWSGIHEPRKCLSLLLKAVASMPADVPVAVRVVGDGPMRSRWESLAAEWQITDRVEWLGWVPHEQAVAELDWADVFAFTSVRDTTGTVLLEALEAGVPVVTLDHQGAGDVITDDCGIKIPVTTVDEAVAGFAAALTEIAGDTLIRRVLSDGAVRRASAYRMDVKRTLWNAVWDKLVPTDTHCKNEDVADIVVTTDPQPTSEVTA